ncbi:hypothetical protein ACWCQZ_44175 [Streptomyces sp. NPDC002285]
MSMTVKNNGLYGTYDRSNEYRGGLGVNTGYEGKGYRFRVIGDDPAEQVESLEKKDGDNTEGYPGTQLSPVPEVTALDKSGNCIKGIMVTFTIDPMGTGSSFITGELTDERETDDRGHSWSTYLRAGPTVGPFTVTASTGNRSVVFTEWVKDLPQVPPVPVITFPAEDAMVYDRRPMILGTGVPGATLTLTYAGGVPIAVQIPDNGEWSVTPTSDLPVGPVTVTAVQATADDTSPEARRTFIVIAPARYEVVPGGPPDVVLVPGGPIGYPGVVVVNTGGAPVGERTVMVELPPGKGLQWGAGGLPDYQFTVLDGGGPYQGTPSSDGRTLTFEGVDLDVPADSRKVMWVGVSATPDALPGYTTLHFTVGGQAANSTPVRIGSSVVNPPFSAEPGGPPEVLLEQGGPNGYPGVKLTNNGDEPVPPLTVTVRLPQDSQVSWGQPGLPDHQLTVLDAQGTTRAYAGTLSDDGQSLTFDGVDLHIPGLGSQSVMWVGVSATDDAPLAYTSLLFSVGDQQSASTPVIVVPPPVYGVEPGGPPDVTLAQGGPTGYPGVRVRNTGNAPLLTDTKVTVALPADRGLSFVAEGGVDHLLTVWSPALGEAHYAGRISEDQQLLTVDKARLNVPVEGTAMLWVAVRAAQDAPLGPTTLTFTADGNALSSTPVNVIPSPAD